MTTPEPVLPVLAWVPDACTLPTAQQPLRLAEFDELFANAVRSSSRVSDTHLRLDLSGQQGLQATVEGLAARENECCSFFTFTVTSEGTDMVRFDIQVPPAHIDVLDALADRAASVGGSPR